MKGLATVGIDGIWGRIVCAFQILIFGELTFQISPENLEMEITSNE